MVHKTTLILLIIFNFSFNYNCFAQKNFVNGYVITNGNDTLKGLINYHNSGRNPQSIQFLNSTTKVLTTYKPLDIKSFFVEGDYYVSKIVSIDMSPTNYAELSYTNKPLMKIDSVFLSVYVEGKTSLYFLKDQLGKEHFFIEKDSTFELINYQYLNTNNDIITVDEYRQQLVKNLSDCKGMADKLIDLKFKASDLITFIKEYDDCKNSPLKFTKVQESTRIEAYGIVGFSVTKTKLITEPGFYLGYINFKTSYNPTFGIALNLVFPKNRKSWSMCNDITYNRNKSSANIDTVINSDYSINKHFDIDFIYLDIVTMVRYQYPTGKVRPFINMGVINSIPVKHYNREKVSSTYYGLERIEEKDILEKTQKHEIGYTAGLGLVVKKFRSELRYARTKGFSPYYGIQTPLNRFSILLEYKF